MKVFLTALTALTLAGCGDPLERPQLPAGAMLVRNCASYNEVIYELRGQTYWQVRQRPPTRVKPGARLDNVCPAA